MRDLLWAALLVVLAYAGCNHRALTMSDAGPTAGDLATMPAAADFASPAADDMGEICVLSAENASVGYGGQALPYAWFGNQGGLTAESCSLFERVIVVLGTMTRAPQLYSPTEPTASFSFATPLQLGTQTVDVTTNIGSSTPVSATLELTDFALDATGQAVASISGRLQAADGSWDGSFVAARCPLFEAVCI
jgi:hypothetical protein